MTSFNASALKSMGEVIPALDVSGQNMATPPFDGLSGGQLDSSDGIDSGIDPDSIKDSSTGFTEEKRRNKVGYA